MEDARYTNLKYICSQINKENINYFKKDNSLKGIVENVNYYYGLKYLENILKYNKKLNWEKIKELNQIGNPDNFKYIINDKEYYLSPTILRYIQFTLDILNHISNLKLDNVNIVEVGGGYGCQSVLLKELCYLFNISIYNYTILDLEEVNNLQKHYIKLTNNDNINCITINDYINNNNNYFISNYALGEFTKDWQELYIEKVIKDIKNGYICWNFSPHNPEIHSYFKNENTQIEEENPQTNCFPIISYIIKY